MKSILKSISLIGTAALLALAGCAKEELVFDHEKPAFEVRDGKILIEAIVPTTTSDSDEIYIAGPFFSTDSATVFSNAALRLTHSTTIDAKWGVYLDPSSFQGGKSLADGFWFISKERGTERTVENGAARHTLDARTGQSYNVYVSKWTKDFGGSQDTGGVELPEHDGVRVYIIDQTGWGAIALYQWGDVNDYGGGWPGAQVSGSTTISGVEYKYFEYGDDVVGLSQNLIFNNNGDGTQLPDYALTFAEGVKDYFLVVTADGVSEGQNPAETPGIPEHDGVRVWAQDQTGWDGLTLYQWGDVNDFGGGWPGAQVSGSETIAGVEYKYFEYGDDIVGLSQNLIFNNNGGGTQLADFALTFEEGVKDYFFLVTAGGATLLDGPGAVQPAPEPEPVYYDGPKIYVRNESGWDGQLYAHYWGSTNTEWPGQAFEQTESVDGVEYLVISTLRATAGQTVGIIFHSDVDDAVNRFETSVTLDTDRFYVLTADSLTEVEAGIRIIVKDETGWPGQIYAHIWNDDGYSTQWPGLAATTGWFGDGSYLVFLVPSELKGQAVNVIFHSDENDGENRFQTVITVDEDRFYVLGKEFFFNEMERGDKTVTLYVEDRTDWGALALYMWGDSELAGGWPGASASHTEEIGGTTWQVFVFEQALGLTEHLIFNNNGGGTQLPDFDLTFSEAEYFLTVDADGVTLAADPR